MKVSNVPFNGTKEQEEELRSLCREHAGQKGALMPILQKAQDIYGYLPYQVQKIIADETGIPLEKIFGVATFYTQFKMEPKGKYVVSICLGTACYVKGAGDVYESIKSELKIDDGECTPDGVFSLDCCRCVGACGLAPVMIVGGDVYGKMTPDRVPEILSQYR